MTTAVRAGNGKTWAEVFHKLPEEGNHWGLINEILYNHALFGRFGANFDPHDFIPDPYMNDEHFDNPNKYPKDANCSKCNRQKKEHPIELSLSDITWLGMLKEWQDRNWVGNLDLSEKNDDFFNSLGKIVYFFVTVANANAEVGHFVGRGSEGNEKDADAFLGAK